MRRFLNSLVFAVLFCWTMSASVSAGKPVWRLQRQAAQAAETGKLERADRILAKARKAAPEDASLAFDHAGVLARQGKIAEALAALEAAVEQGFRQETALRDSDSLAPLHGNPAWEALLAAVRANEADFKRRLEEARTPLDPRSATPFADVGTLLDAKEQADRDFYAEQSDEPWEIRRARYVERWDATLKRLAAETTDDAEREKALAAALRERVDDAITMDLHWPSHAIDRLGGAANSYLDAFPEGEPRDSTVAASRSRTSAGRSRCSTSGARGEEAASRTSRISGGPTRPIATGGSRSWASPS